MSAATRSSSTTARPATSPPRRRKTRSTTPWSARGTSATGGVKSAPRPPRGSARTSLANRNAVSPNAWSNWLAPPTHRERLKDPRPRAEHPLHFLSASTGTTPTAISRSGHLYRARSAPHAVVGDRASREPLDLRNHVPVVAALLSDEGGRSAARGMRMDVQRRSCRLLAAQYPAHRGVRDLLHAHRRAASERQACNGVVVPRVFRDGISRRDRRGRDGDSPLQDARSHPRHGRRMRRRNRRVDRAAARSAANAAGTRRMTTWTAIARRAVRTLS